MVFPADLLGWVGVPARVRKFSKIRVEDFGLMLRKAERRRRLKLLGESSVLKLGLGFRVSSLLA